MGVSSFNIGKDASLDLVHPKYGIIGLGLVTSFESNPMTTRLESKPITGGGLNYFRNVFGGWEGSFDIDRSNDIVDALVDILESNYYAGNPETYFQLTQTINNPDGGIVEYMFKNLVVIPQSAGTWAGEAKVTEKLSWVCSRRERK